jgi:hypothetical protein
MNIGHFSRLSCDSGVYDEKLYDSMNPTKYRMDTNQIRNCGRCLSTIDKRGKFGVSTIGELSSSESQDLVDLESVFSNRNVKISKARTGRVNPINPILSKSVVDQNVCLSSRDSGPDILYTRFSHPAQTYRDSGINRFYDLLHNPQEHIFSDFSANTRLEAKDNYVFTYPKPWLDLSQPVPKPDQPKQRVCSWK